MTKKSTWLWWILLIIVVIAGWYLWQSNRDFLSTTSNQTTTSNTTAPGGGLSMGSSSLDSAIAGIIQEGTQEQSAVGADAGEDALVKFVGQQVSDLSQIYDENSY